MSDAYDVIVIGSGPAGYPAAIRAAQNKLSVACIDEWKNTDGSFAFGGTCLNAGCIPSKALLESSELYQRAKEEFAVHGINIGGLQLDLAAMQKRRASVVKTMTGGIGALFKASGVIGVQGHGRLLPANKVLVTAPDGTEKTLTAKHVVLASGSIPVRLKNVPHDGRYIVDSWNALEFDAVPARLGVIGAGVIGLELGSVWRRLAARSRCSKRWISSCRSRTERSRKRRCGTSRSRGWTSSWEPRSRARRLPAARSTWCIPMRRASTRCRWTNWWSPSGANPLPKDCWRKAPGANR